MKVTITQTFTGYPDGKDASRTVYEKGQAVDLPDAYAKLVVGKGLATASGPAAAPGPAVSGAAVLPAHDKQGS